jgi:hypothetical protein
MSRARRNVFGASSAQHYIVTWNLQWQIIDVAQPPRGADLRAALANAVARLEHEGWSPEIAAEFGFTFVSRAGERRLVMITARDPFASTAQSFSPFDSGHS